ncbi:MAG: sigma-70 family RNA polymerase sigma factor [Planctomycetes bacterium]|nr:sigma-70 family RNA polymerase sigma factor [Planctomycetota bacterium]
MEKRHRFEELLAHGPWVRRLARSLVRDRARADDLEQQAWLAALEHPPRADFPLQRWFAAVLRNRVREEQRADARRTRREELAAADESARCIDTLEALELSRALALAVAELEEPFRGTLFRRYYEDLEPRRIAELDGLPLKTVKSRLARGLEKLRERLDREQPGGRTAWMAACVPLLRRHSTPLVLGGIAVKTKLALAAAVLLLFVLGALRLAGLPAPLPEPQALAPAAPADPRASELATAESDGARAEISAMAPTPAAQSPVGALCPYAQTPTDLAGRAIDARGQPLEGVRLFLVTPEQAAALREPGASSAVYPTGATSDAAGRFTIRLSRGGLIVMGERADLVTLLGAYAWAPRRAGGLTVVLATAIDAGGSVVDERGTAIAGAQVQALSATGLRETLELAGAAEIPWRARTGADGRFEFERVPAGPCAALSAFHALHEPASVPMPALPDPNLRLVLGSRAGARIAGVVLEPDGAPATGACVGMGQIAVRCDGLGRFEVELDPSLPDHDGVPRVQHSKEIGAAKSGFGAAHLDEPETGWPAFVTLLLTQAPLEIRGRVEGPDGAPLSSIQVQLVNEHVLGMLPSQAGSYFVARSLEGLARQGDEFEAPAVTSRDGSFVVRGLLDQPYVLRAFDPRSLRTLVSEAIPAGSAGVVLHFPSSSGITRVAGRVLSLAGEPLANVQILPLRPAGVVSSMRVRLLPGELRTTDGEGRFDLGGMESEGLQLQLMGDGLQTIVDWKPPPFADLSALEPRLARRLRLLVELTANPERADSVVVLDAQGRELELWIRTRESLSFERAQPLKQGRSEVLLVAETAATVAIRKDGAEVERRAVVLDPAGLTTLRF